MNIKSFLVTAAMALATFGASAGTASFADGVADFKSEPIAKAATTVSETITLTGLAAGSYDIEGSISGAGMSFTSVMLDGHAWVLEMSGGKYKFGSITYTGTQPLVLTVLGTKTAGFSASFSGSVIAAPVPEPETYAMLLAGLGLMGAVARRRSKNNA
jgi:hypothetical protein